MSNVFKYLIGSTGKGFESGVEEESKLQSEQAKFKEQQLLRKQTIEDEDKRQQNLFQQQDKLQKSGFDYQSQKQQESDRLKGIDEQRKADLKAKQDQENLNHNNQIYSALKTGVYNTTDETGKPVQQKLSYKDALTLANNWKGEFAEKDKLLGQFGAPNGVTEKRSKGYTKPDKNKMIRSYESTQKWDAQQQKYVTTETGSGKPEPLHETGVNGETMLNKNLSKVYTDKFVDIVAIKQNINQALNGQKVIKTKGIGGAADTYYTPSELYQELQDSQANYANIVKETASDNFTKWYSGLYNKKNAKKENAGNPSPDDYWNLLKADYTKGSLDEADFESGVNIFRATYGEDPIRKYGN